MSVVLAMIDGARVHLDRNLHVHQVTVEINRGRLGTALMEFPNDETPSRPVFVDPRHVIRIETSP